MSNFLAKGKSSNDIRNLCKKQKSKTEQAFQAIEDAKRILADLEQITVRAADGKLPDIGETAHLTHGLREAVDRILVGIVESATLPCGQEAA